ncbi:Copia protein, partial [Mucuna pruriens]
MKEKMKALEKNSTWEIVDRHKDKRAVVILSLSSSPLSYKKGVRHRRLVYPLISDPLLGYYVFVGGNLICWKIKKQNVVIRSSVEAEYRALANFSKSFNLKKLCKMTLIRDNQPALDIASNLIFHEKTKNIEVDCHFIRKKIKSRDTTTSFVNSSNQLPDDFAKSLRGPRISYINNKLENALGKGLIYAQIVGGYSEADWVSSPSDGRSTFGYCVLVGRT